MSETKTITVSRSRQAELEKLYRRFLSETDRVDKLQVRRRQALANSADSLLRLFFEIDRINGHPLDWEESYLADFDRSGVIIRISGFVQ